MIASYQGKILRWNGPGGVKKPAEALLHYITTDDVSGGTISYDGLYRIHTFTSSGSFVVNVSINTSILLVGGGGGGSGTSAYTGCETQVAGGGGGGQVRQQT